MKAESESAKFTPLHLETDPYPHLRDADNRAVLARDYVDHERVEEMLRRDAASPQMYEALRSVQADIARAAKNDVIWPDTKRALESALRAAEGA